MPIDRRRRRGVLGAPATVTAKGALSVNDTRYEADVSLTQAKAHVIQLTLDQTNNLIKVTVDGTASSTSTSGTFNTQTGALFWGAGVSGGSGGSLLLESGDFLLLEDGSSHMLLDSVDTATTTTGYLGYLATYDAVLSGAALTAATAQAAAWLAPVLTPPPTVLVTLTGTTVWSIVPYVQDVAGAGWQIIDAVTTDFTSDVASFDSTTVSLVATSGVGNFGTILVTVRSNHPLQPTAQVPVQVQVVRTTLNGGYERRRRIIIPASRMSGTLPIENYVFLFHETNPSFVLGDASSPFSFQFALDDGTILDAELISHDHLLGEIAAWVRIPSLTPTADFRFWFYYTFDTLDPVVGSPGGVWGQGNYYYVVDLPTGADREEAHPGFAAANVAAGTGFNGIGTASFNGSTSSDRQEDLTYFEGWSAITWQVIAAPSSSMSGTNKGYLAQGPFNSNDFDHGIVLRNSPVGAQGGAQNVLVWGVKTTGGFARYESSANKS